MNPQILLRKAKYLRATIHSQYGNGLRAWYNCAYYSFFRINTFYIYKASFEKQQKCVFDLPGVTYHHPTIPELDILRAGKNLPREFFCDQLHKVSQCCIAQVEGEIAYIHWIYRHGDFSRFLVLDDKSVEINYVITLPQFRGKRINNAALFYSLNCLKKDGISNVYSVIHNENIASIKSYVRSGFVEFEKIVTFGPFNKKIRV